MDATQQRWIEANPFLEPLARFQEAIARAADGITAAAAGPAALRGARRGLPRRRAAAARAEPRADARRGGR